MKYLMVLTLLLPFIVLAGCADPAARVTAFKAYNEALANCNDKPGCLAATQAAFYSGALESKEDSVISILAALFPYARLAGDMYTLGRGGANSGGYGMFVKGNNNQFIGFNKTSADRSSSVFSPFDATSSPTMTQSWADMYNQDNIRSQNQ